MIRAQERQSVRAAHQKSKMARYDYRSPRLYVDAALSSAASVALDAAQANYLRNVLRLPAGARVLVFNGRDGEWQAVLAENNQRGLRLCVETRLREQTP